MSDSSSLSHLTAQYVACQKSIKTLETQRDQLKTQLKIALKEQGLTEYEDEDQNRVTLTTQFRESLDKTKVASLLSEEQYQSILRNTPCEVLRVLSRESREKIREFQRASPSNP